MISQHIYRRKYVLKVLFQMFVILASCIHYVDIISEITCSHKNSMFCRKGFGVSAYSGLSWYHVIGCLYIYSNKRQRSSIRMRTNLFPSYVNVVGWQSSAIKKNACGWLVLSRLVICSIQMWTSQLSIFFVYSSRPFWQNCHTVNNTLVFPDLSLDARSWRRHQMETCSALLVLREGNPPATGGFPSQRPVTWSFDVFFDLRLNIRLSKQSWGWWFET